MIAELPEQSFTATMSRVWDMPNYETFKIPSVRGFVQKYMMKSVISVDPFARNCRWATHTNDLNPHMAADWCLEALTFLGMLERNGVKADLIFFDPPYSPRQIAECYSQVGREVTAKDTQSKTWSDWKDAILPICSDDAVVLSFGWNTNGMGINRGFDIIELVLVAHGGMHNDTICMAERKRPNLQQRLI